MVEVYNKAFFTFCCGILDSLTKQSKSVPVGLFRRHHDVHFITLIDDTSPIDAPDSVGIEDDRHVSEWVYKAD
mgnify:CR=1 FL=1